MTRLFIDGAEWNSTFMWSYVSGFTISNSPQSGMTGSYSFGTFGGIGAGYYEMTLPSTQTEVYMAFKEYPGVREDYDQACMGFYDSGGTCIASLRWYRQTHPWLILRALRGTQTAGTTLEDSSEWIRTDLVHLIEIHYKPLNTSGEFQVKVDGNLLIDYSGDTTAGLEDILKIRLGGTGSVSCGGSHGWDDVVVDNADWIGNTRIQRLYPTGAGSSTQWDPSTGANYACMDEVTAVDTDYVSTNVSGEIDSYACVDLSGIGEVKCIVVGAKGAYEGSPSPTHQQICIRTSGEYHYGGDFTPSLSFASYSKMWELNPATSGEWTSAEINALEIGVRATP